MYNCSLREGRQMKNPNIFIFSKQMTEFKPPSFEELLKSAIMSAERTGPSAEDILNATLDEFEGKSAPVVKSREIPLMNPLGKHGDEMDMLTTQLQSMIKHISSHGPPQMNEDAMKIIGELFSSLNGVDKDEKTGKPINLEEMLSFKNRARMMLKFFWAVVCEKLAPSAYVLTVFAVLMINIVTVYLAYHALL